MKSLRVKVLIVLLLCLLGAEIAVRMAGMVDFPLYDADTNIGYIPKASQTGSFLNKNDYTFNARHMGASEFQPDAAKVDILLVGDSVVLGGNPLRQADRLGPRLSQAVAEANVWPISAGSWSLQNELTYLEQNKDIVSAVDAIYFVLNKGDFESASSWRCETTHPTHRPVLALLYLAQKYVGDWSACSVAPSPLPVPPRDVLAQLRAFMTSAEVKGKEIRFYLYPDRPEFETREGLDEWQNRFAQQLKAAGALKIYSVARDDRWQLDYYRDWIHPNGQGSAALAKIMSNPASSAWLN